MSRMAHLLIISETCSHGACYGSAKKTAQSTLLPLKCFSVFLITIFNYFVVIIMWYAFDCCLFCCGKRICFRKIKPGCIDGDDYEECGCGHFIYRRIWPRCFKSDNETVDYCLGLPCCLLAITFALPVAIVYGLIALVYLLFGSCFKLCNICKSKQQVSPGEEGQSSDAVADSQSADHVLHV